MAPAKKKGKKLPSAPEPSSSGSADPPPVQRKRGRPRKIVKEAEAESFRPPPEHDLGTTAAAGIKRVKLKKVDEEEQPAKPQPPVKKDSRRRKSEPHRAPGVLIEGL